jgi:signal transduction histidine kinase
LTVGPGVAPEIADTMFEPFASTTNGGTGLGLAISAYVMQMLSGRINYRKMPDRGACFTVKLPLPQT